MPFSDCYNGAASAALCMAARRAGRGGRAWPGGTIDEARRLLRAGGGWCRDSAISAPYNGAAAAALALAARRARRGGRASAPARPLTGRGLLLRAVGGLVRGRCHLCPLQRRGGGRVCTSGAACWP